MRFPVSQITLEAGDVSDRLPLPCSLKMPSGRTASELDHSIIHTRRNSTQKHYWVTSVSWLCRTQSSTSPKSISQDPLRCGKCCSWRCYLWVSSVQSNITLIGQQWLELQCPAIAMVTQQTAPQLTSFVELPLAFTHAVECCLCVFSVRWNGQSIDWFIELCFQAVQCSLLY